MLISTSGIREVILEMAEGGKRRGLAVIGVVSREHCAQAPGPKLTELADVVLDNGAPAGDTLLSLAGGRRTGPFSTLGGALIMNLLRCEVAQRLFDRGIEPVFLPSHQVAGPGVEDELERFYSAYARSVAPLYARAGS
jgi:uncharacterized phosphosugar-binding protein